MTLSHNIKCYRKAKGISQEAMADWLHVSQPTYYRIENNEIACAKYLSRIADVFGTTPDVLQNYHLNLSDTIEPEIPESFRIKLTEKDRLLENQQVEITFLKRYATYLHTVWRAYCRAG